MLLWCRKNCMKSKLENFQLIAQNNINNNKNKKILMFDFIVTKLVQKRLQGYPQRVATNRQTFIHTCFVAFLFKKLISMGTICFFKHFVHAGCCLYLSNVAKCFCQMWIHVCQLLSFLLRNIMFYLSFNDKILTHERNFHVFFFLTNAIFYAYLRWYSIQYSIQPQHTNVSTEYVSSYWQIICMFIIHPLLTRHMFQIQATSSLAIMGFLLVQCTFNHILLQIWYRIINVSKWTNIIVRQLQILQKP